MPLFNIPRSAREMINKERAERVPSITLRLRRAYITGVPFCYGQDLNNGPCVKNPQILDPHRAALFPVRPQTRVYA